MKIFYRLYLDATQKTIERNASYRIDETRGNRWDIPTLKEAAGSPSCRLVNGFAFRWNPNYISYNTDAMESLSVTTFCHRKIAYFLFEDPEKEFTFSELLTAMPEHSMLKIDLEYETKEGYEIVIDGLSIVKEQNGFNCGGEEYPTLFRILDFPAYRRSL